MEQWQSGKLSYGDYAKARQSYVNSWNGLATEDRSFYDLLVPYLRDYFGGGEGRASHVKCFKWRSRRTKASPERGGAREAGGGVPFLHAARLRRLCQPP